MTLSAALSQPIQDHSTTFLDAFFAQCQQEFGVENTTKWLAALEIFSQSSSEIIFAAPSKFIRDWVIREYLDIKGTNLLHVAQSIQSQIKKLSIVHVERKADNQAKTLDSSKKIVNLSKYDNVFAFGTELNSRFKFESFVTAKYNKLALSMAKIAAKVEGQIDLFDESIPLFIHGGVGMGKTHLAQAIAWKIQEQDKSKKVVYLSAEKFMYHFVQSVRNNDVMDFKEKMRSIDVLIVDDVQFIAGKESTQQEFMNSFNRLVEENKQVVLVCDRKPCDLENIDEKLKSRISGGMIVNFKNPDYQDRVDILCAKAGHLNQEICPKVISYLAEKITASVRDLEGALKKLIASKLLLDEEITIENAKAIVADYINIANASAPNVQNIQKAVAAFYDIKMSDLSSNSRHKSVVRPRQVAMYLAKTMTNLSLPKIGQAFGGKNHATVIHSAKLIQGLMENDPQITKEVKTLEEKLRNA